MKKRKGKLRLGIIWANPYCSNLGVEALAYSTLILFEEVSKRTGLKFEYIMWGSNGPSRDVLNLGNNKIQITNVRTFLGGDLCFFLKRCLSNPLRLLTPVFLLKFLQFDLVVDMGSGDSYTDIYGISRFRNIDFTKKICRLLKLEYILLPQTFGPYDSREAQNKARKSIDASSLVLTRDEMSYDCIKNMLPFKEVLKTIDVAFFLPYQKKSLNNNKIKVGINISGLLWYGGYTQDNQFGLKVNYRDLVYNILNYFAAFKEVEIHLIPHVIYKGNVNVDEDSHLVKELMKQYPESILSPLFTTPIEAKSYISSLDFFLGARMHACIAAISSGVPVYPLAYSRKFNGLFIKTLQYPYVGDLRAMSMDQIMENMQKIYQMRQDIEMEIQHIIETIIVPSKEKLIMDLCTSIVKYDI